MKILIQAVQFEADSKLIDKVNNKIESLGKFFDRVTDEEVFLKLTSHSGQVKDKIVEIKMNLPQGQVFAKEECKSFEEALSLASDSIRRQLKRYKEKMRN